MLNLKNIVLILLLAVSTFTHAQINLDSGLVAYYPFDGNADDYSDSLNHGVVNGAVLTAGVRGVANTAYDISDGQIDIPTGIIFPDSTITISFWLNHSNEVNKWIFRGESYYDATIYFYAYDELVFPSCSLNIQNGSNSFDYFRLDPSAITPNYEIWNHYLYEIRSDSSFLFVNNELEYSQKTYDVIKDEIGYQDVIIGDFDSWTEDIVLIDEFMIHDRVLSKEEKEYLLLNDVILSTSNNKENTSFKLYPNPTSGLLNFSKELSNIAIYDALGNVVLTEANASSLNTFSFEKGIYMISSDQGSSKFVVE